MKRLSLVLVLSALACRTPSEAVPPPPLTPESPAAAPGPTRITLVATNDWHGWVMSQTDNYPQGEIRSGGAATFAGYMKVLREDNPNGVVLLDAGDLFQGTLLSNSTEGETVIDAFNELGFDAAAIGNHEFDYGPVGPVSATQQGMDPFGALKARIKQARFPLLSTNIYEEDTGKRPEWMHPDGAIILNRKGVKIGIFGLTTPQTPQVTLPINVATLRFGPLAPEALTASKRLRERGADVVVAMVHAGGKCGSVANAHDLASCDTDAGEIFAMMKGLPEGTLDAVIAGHTHAQIAHFVNGAPVIESWALGRYFGLIELYLDPVTKKVLTDKTQIRSAVELCETMDAELKSCEAKRLKPKVDQVKPVAAVFRGQTIVADPAVAAALEPAYRKVAELQNRDLGLSVPDTIGRAYENESPLGSFLADSMRAMAKADIALMNPGGLRADLKKGQLHYGGVYEVLPFDNQVATLNLTGEELMRVLMAAFGSKKGVFQVSGIEVRLSRCPSPDRLRNVTLSGGKPLEPNGKYRVVMPDFLARGGDGLGPVIATIDPTRVDLGDARGSNLRDELVTYWQAKKEGFPVPRRGRVAFLPDGETCSTGAKLNEHLGQP